MKYVIVVAVALLLFALLQTTAAGPKPWLESPHVELKPIGLKLSSLAQLAGSPEFRQYAELILLANNTQAEKIRQLATLVKQLDAEMSTLASAVAEKNFTEAKRAYAAAKATLEQIRRLLLELKLWEEAKDYYTAAYLRVESYGKALEERPPANLTLIAPSKARAGSTIYIEAWAQPPNGTLSIFLEGRLVKEVPLQGHVRVPVVLNVYKPEAVVSALYMPNDGKHGAAQANATIHVEYVNTTIRLQCPTEVKWGRAASLEGVVSSDVQQVVVKIGELTMNASVSRGVFQVLVNTTALPPGVYNATVYAPPSGIYAPASASCVFNITAEPPPLAQPPQVLIAGIPAALTPYFRYTPSLLEATGYRKFAIYIPPHMPYSGAVAEFEAVLINPVQIIALGGFAVFLTTMALKRARRVDAEVRLEYMPYDYSVLAARYLRALAQRLGITLFPGTTIRELLSEVAKVDKSLYEKAWKIGRRLEEVLYGGAQPTAEDYEELR